MSTIEYASGVVNGVEYVVMKSGAAMPAKCWGRYSRIGLIKIEAGHTPRLIADTGVAHVIHTWERRNEGTTERCAAARAVAEAIELAKRYAQEELAESAVCVALEGMAPEVMP